MPALCLLLSTLVANAGTGQSESARMFDLPYAKRDLANGLRVYVVPTAHQDLVSLQITVSTGSRNEVEPGKSGFAHFFEHMMFRGTPNYSPEAYQAVITRAGANQNAYTSDDYTNYYTDFAAADLENILIVEADRFQNLAYTEEQFRTEAQAVKGEYLKNFANPIRKVFERVQDLAFSVHPYKHTTMGFFADIEAMPDQLEYGKAFFDRWYRPGNTTITLVGDVESDQALALIERHFGGWQAKANDFNIPSEPPPAGPRYEHIQWEGPTLPFVAFAYRTPAFSTQSNDLAALQLLAEIWFGQNSELYQRMVVNEHLSDTLFALMHNSKDPYLGLFGARVNQGADPAKVIRALQKTIVRARTEAVDFSVLEQTKARLKYGTAATLTTPSAIAGVLANFVHFDRDIETINVYYAQFDSVSREDLLRVANDVFIDRARTVVTLSNDPEFAGASTIVDLDPRVDSAHDGVVSRLALIEKPAETPLIDLQLLFRTGAAYDPPGKAGLAQLTSAMLADAGSRRRGYAELQRVLYPLAAPIAYHVDKEMVSIRGTVHRDNLALWYEVLREQMLQPGFSKDDYSRLKQQQINAIRVDLRSNNDEELGKEVLYEQIYGARHAYGRLNAGHVAQLESITLEDVRQFYAQQFTRTRLRLAVGGGYSDAFKKQLLKDFAQLPEGDPADSERRLITDSGGRRALIIEKESPAVAVSFGFPLQVRRGDPDFLALWLARSWLGEHRNSSAQLYKRIRETRGMNYGDYAYIDYFPNGMYLSTPEPNYGRAQNIFQVWLRPLRNNSDAHFATRAAMYELRALVTDGLSEEDFQVTREFLSKFVAQMADSPRRQLGYALDSQYYGIAPFHEYVRDGLAQLTREQVNQTVRQHLDLDHIQFVYVSADAADLKQRLGTNQTSPISYNSDKPADLLAEDKQIESLDLRLSADSVRILDAADLFE